MVRAHLNLRAVPGRRDELLRALDTVELGVAARSSDLIEVEVFVPIDNPDRVLVVSSWPSAEHFERWRTGPESGRLEAALEGLLAGKPETHVYRLVDALD